MAAAEEGGGNAGVEVSESELRAGLAAAEGRPGAAASVSPKALQAALAVITKPQYETWSPQDYVRPPPPLR